MRATILARATAEDMPSLPSRVRLEKNSSVPFMNLSYPIEKNDVISENTDICPRQRTHLILACLGSDKASASGYRP